MSSTAVVCPRCGIVSLARGPKTHTCCHCDAEFPLAADRPTATA